MNKRILVSLLPFCISFFAMTSCSQNEWYLDENYINSLVEKGESSIGTIKDVVVNGQTHKVRLIGINHDVDENNNKLRTTWEFANIISDTKGNSIGYQWHDTDKCETANYDYLNSSIRKILTGRGDFSTTVYCSTKDSGDQWDKNYTNKTVISMLPSNLVKQLKKVKKQVRTGPDFDKDVDYVDELFLLSTNEIGCTSEAKTTGTLYPYYKNATRETYIKKQVNNTVYGEYPMIKTGETIWKEHIYNFAGFNKSTDNRAGGYYWLGTPRSDYNYSAYYSDSHGNIFTSYTYIKTYGVAPCFCI